MTSGEPTQPIYVFLRDRIAADEPVEAIDLPDAPPPSERARFGAGALDGVLTHHLRGDGEEQRQAAEALFQAVRRMCGRWATRRRFRELSALAASDGLVHQLDPLLAKVRECGLDGRRLHAVALGLATTSATRGPVKLGVALLGLFPSEHHRDVLLTLGRHNEFTLYAAGALDTGEPVATDDLWELARSVTGWGRIHVVERLAHTDRPDVLDWILREGFRNSVLNEYLAFLAATRGGLLARLTSKTVDEDLLHAAGDILTALFAGGPAEDIGDYPDGAAATLAFLSHLKTTTDLRHLLAVDAISAYVERDEPMAPWPAGWTTPVRARIADECAAIIGRPEWAEQARRDLASTDEPTFWRAERAYGVLGKATLPALLDRLRADPFDATAWQRAAERADATSIEQVVALAIELLPLEEVATGPSDSAGVGPQYRAHNCLDLLIPQLGRFPGVGWPLLAAALRSPVVRNRNIAVNALRAWTQPGWPNGVGPALRAAIDAEPLADVRSRMVALRSSE